MTLSAFNPLGWFWGSSSSKDNTNPEEIVNEVTQSSSTSLPDSDSSTLNTSLHNNAVEVFPTTIADLTSTPISTASENSSVAELRLGG